MLAQEPLLKGPEEAERKGLGWKAEPKGFKYNSNILARDLVETREGQCIAFATLYTALARRLGLDVHPAKVIVDALGKRLAYTKEGPKKQIVVPGEGHVCPVDEAGLHWDPLYTGIGAYGGQHKEVRPWTDEEFLSHVWTNLGAAHLKKGNLDEAIKCQNKAIEINPEDAELWNNLGNAHLKKGNLTQAIDCYKKSLKKNPKDAITWYNLGNAQSNSAKAIRFYKKALKINPEYASALTNLGNAHFSKGNLAKAIDFYNKSLKITPEDADVWTNLGIAYRKKGNLDEAINSYKTAIEINPGDAEVWTNLGIAHEKRGNLEEAEKCYKKAEKIKRSMARTVTLS